MSDPEHDHSSAFRTSGSGEQSSKPEQQRRIVHVDLDAFYASVEQRDNPELRGKPVAVGGSRERGVVAAASYEARRFGVHSAMPSVTARRKCPELIFVKPRFDVYREVSRQIREIFYEYTPLVEPLSLDEAYLDVTENLKGIPYATQVAREIRAKIWEETHLTASAGISFNKFLAKMASDQNKPNGQFVITPENGAGLRREPAGRQVPWHRPGHSQEDERTRHLHRPGSEGPVARASCRSASARPEPTTTGSPAPSTIARSSPTASASRWGPRTPLRRIWRASRK